MFITERELKRLYNLPHYYYRVFADDKEVFGSVDKKLAESKYKETVGDYVELVQYNHGVYQKILKSKEN